jgi:molybdopterin/thiamine biosynthesis adenylyltransferase
MKTRELTARDREIYEWQMWVPDFGEDGQKKLKNASVLVSRCGGVGGTVAFMLAAAGVGSLILYHGGSVRPSDLNRQLLMTRNWIGRNRIDSIKKRLHEFNPDVEIVAVGENICEENAAHAVSMADVVVDCAPLFEERFALNKAAVIQRKPIIECAMFSLEGQITTIEPGRTPCLRCLYPETPREWKRQFPVIGGVSGVVASLGAMEVIKVMCGLGEPLYNTLLHVNTLDMTFRRVKIKRNPTCPECGGRIARKELQTASVEKV